MIGIGHSVTQNSDKQYTITDHIRKSKGWISKEYLSMHKYYVFQWNSINIRLFDIQLLCTIPRNGSEKKPQKLWIKLIDVEQIGAISNKDEDAEMG